MSTRSQILFKFSDGQVLTYRHSDGYPTGVIPDLLLFLKWNKGRNDQYDYLIPNYFYWCKKWLEHYMEGKNSFWAKDLPISERKKPIQERNLSGNEPVLIGYGLDYNGMLHGDIEYFYTVEFFEIGNNMEFRIRVYEPEYKSDESFDLKYETPEQLIRNTLPLMEFNIKDLDKFVITEDEIQAIQDKKLKEKQDSCKHEITRSYIDSTSGTDKEIVYCRNCSVTLEGFIK